MEDMKKMLGRKKEADPMKKDAKLSALKHLRNVASEAMKGDLGDKMNKVTVAADNKEDLTKGLDKAKDILGGAEGSPTEEGDETSEIEKAEAMMGGEEGSPEEEASETTEQEIDEMMAKLMEMKKKLANA